MSRFGAARTLAATLCAAVSAMVALSGCSASGADADRPVVVVTTNILGDIVENVAGDAAEITTLMKPGADPHSFEISAREASLMDRADLVVSNGLGLEEGLQQHLARVAEGGGRVFVAGDHVEVIAYDDGEAAGTPDPHLWTDPGRVDDVVVALEAQLLAVDGVDRRAIEAATDRYRGELAALDAEMSAAFAEIPADRRALVTNHHVFGYLARRFDFRVLGAAVPGGTTLASPGAADLHDLASTIAAAGVPTIFAESSQPDRLMRVLAHEAGIHVDVVELYTESLTAPGGGAETYLAMMRANTARIVDGLTT